MAKRALLIIFISIFICLAAIYLLTKAAAALALRQFDVAIHNSFKFTKPAQWAMEKNPDPNNVLISLNQKLAGVSQTVCQIDISFVKPDKQYSFQGWLQTSLANSTFLGASQQTTVLGLPAMQGTYAFENKQMGPAQNERIIIKKGIYFADFTLFYKTAFAKSNPEIIQQCRQAQNSIINSSNINKLN